MLIAVSAHGHVGIILSDPQWLATKFYQFIRVIALLSWELILFIRFQVKFAFGKWMKINRNSRELSKGI